MVDLKKMQDVDTLQFQKIVETLSKVYADGKGSKDRFYINKSQDAILWRSYFPQKNSCGKLVEHFVPFEKIIAAAEQKKHIDFWKMLSKNASVWECNSENIGFEECVQDFLENPDYVGCNDLTKAQLISLAKRMLSKRKE